MAKLIPSFLDDSTVSGERDVFNMLATGPEDWVVIHSLDLAPWNRSLRTEIDFLILVPDTGILCVEVKSHDDLSFDGERWHPESIKRSPFKQAADARYTFVRRIAELVPVLRHVPVLACCIFPRAPFDVPPNVSVAPWEVIDRRVFQSCRTGLRLCAELQNRMKQSIDADGRLHRLSHALTAAQMDLIVRSCVPVQRRRPHLREEFLRREEELERLLRDQQKPVLALTRINARVLVAGGAGTGKTLIAAEVARRSAALGRRVALLCYNQLAGDRLRDEAAVAGALPPNLVAGRAIRIMAEMAGISIPDSPPAEYWDSDLPRELEARLTDPEFRASAIFDFLVLDEAQDIFARPGICDCLSQFLAGGLERGSFAIFGDFENQVLADRASMRESLCRVVAVEKPSQWRLEENCRNYRIVGDTALRLSGLAKDVYSGYLRPGGGIQCYDIFFYDDDAAQLARLNLLLKEFAGAGFKPSDITILSLKADESSAAFKLRGAGFRLRPVRQNGPNTAYGTVHAFKGMENKVIILTDVALSDTDFHRHLFYVGMTRATETVRVLCHESSRDTLSAWFAGSLTYERSV